MQTPAVTHRPGSFNSPRMRTLHLIMSGFIGILFAISSAAGIVFPGALYPTAGLYASFLPNDLVNLVFAVPLYILFYILALRNRRPGIPGLGAMLLYILYNGIAYLVALRNPFSFILNGAIAAACLAELILLLISQSPQSMPGADAVRKPKLYGSILLGMGLIFIVRAAINLLGAAQGTVQLSPADTGVNTADGCICLAWVLSGLWLLLGRKESARRMFAAVICYLHGSLLFISLLLFMALQPLLCATAFAAADLLVIAGMSLLLIIPCVLLLRTIMPAKAEQNPPA